MTRYAILNERSKSCLLHETKLKINQKSTDMKTDLHLIHSVSEMFQLVCGRQCLQPNISQFHVLLMQLLLQLQY